MSAFDTTLLIGQFYSGRISNNGTAAIAQAIGNQDNSPTRQLTDTVFVTIHRQILRQFTDTFEDNSPTLLFKVNDL